MNSLEASKTKEIRSVSGILMPLPIRDIDTDMIIAAEFLTSTSQAGYGVNLFKRLREKDPDFPLNLQQYQSANIIVADSNFGCGSSREHAVWAIKGAGFRAVIAPSFADIFKNNSGKNGLLTIELEEDVVNKLLALSKKELRATIDLENQTVTLDSDQNQSWSFDYNPFRRHCLLNGLDDLDYLLSHKVQIDQYFNNNSK